MSWWRSLIAGALRGASALADGSRAVPIALQHQLQTNWCWAACTSTASAHFDPAGTWGQCAVVNAELGQTGCCADGSTTACNQPWYLDRALQRTGNFAGKSTGGISFAAIRREIDAGRPVGARIRWKDNTGHFVLLTGYSSRSGAQFVDVQDPWTGSSSVALETFATAYKGTGAWTHTYLTRA